MTQNIQAILDWANANRPDLAPMIKEILSAEMQDTRKGQAYLLLMTIGFEAGREFQHKTPTTPLGPLI